jgi:hypothetical protein
MTIPVILVMAALIISGCGNSEWGIDHGQEKEISHGPLNEQTGLYRCTIDDATFIEPGSIVRPIEDDTQVRVWHFQNSEEYVCVLRGMATVSTSESNG